MGEWVGRNRKARRSYGFDEVALVPGAVTIDPEDTDIGFKIGKWTFPVPIFASAMDGVVDTRFAIEMGKLGGMAVLNLEGVQTRYENPDTVIRKITASANGRATGLVRTIYERPIQEKLIVKRIKEIKKAKVPVLVSAIPQRAERFGSIAQDSGCDVFVVQSTVSSARHYSTHYESLSFEKFCRKMKIPVIVGNTVTYQSTLELMESGVSALLVGIGPGSACTTRGVLGLGVPQVTAICDAAAARDFYSKKSGRYVPIVADGGMTTGGDICKAFACGADAVMVGSAFARAKEAPGHGFHWGMATPHQNLPRGTRIRVGTTGTLKEILFGPATQDDGSQNLVGALKTCMGNLGARTVRDMHLAELVIAPAIKTEGKIFQATQRVGMSG
ncbi:MAG: GuaB3 family IMP dehydrogenase-related protein [Candidatus Omnitrophica bacterium]|nr:GuaB3 family IMP dehydrogenase-related protein [Candidatus Omnitrophota bacterium]